ncbi:ADP-ribose pyrophosphatase [Brevinematales bacterium NS]|nr:NUDIX hydrolase [Brevinematales bacterium]QJR22760.1 ADP-ribose pyrophosphatase [Brevinematales bacterium NS]
MKSNRLPFDNLEEKTLSTTLLHQGKSFSFHSDEVLFPNGKKGKRDYVRYPEAVVILPLVEEGVLFIRQYRYAPGKVLLEIPAGKVDPGEDILLTVRRELREETGYDSEDIEYLLSYYPCPGYSTEKIHVYVARNLFPSPLEADEDEFIQAEILSLEEAKRAIREGMIEDGKTILTLLAYGEGLKREEKA